VRDTKTGEVVCLALAIEENTEETVRYLRSREVPEVTLPPSIEEEKEIASL
jgi:hypothetical protein